MILSVLEGHFSIACLSGVIFLMWRIARSLCIYGASC